MILGPYKTILPFLPDFGFIVLYFSYVDVTTPQNIIVVVETVNYLLKTLNNKKNL